MPTPVRSLTLLFATAVAVVSCQAMAPAPRSDADTAAPPAGGCRVIRVLDGDTIDMTCSGAGRFRARLTDYDTPEAFEPGCAAEARLARQATARLRALVRESSSVEPSFGGVDRYDRRLVRLRLDGQSVAAILISEGLAVPYSGGPRIDWCDRLT